MKWQFAGYSRLRFIFLDCLNCSCPFFFFELERWRRIVKELRVWAESSDFPWRCKQAAETSHHGGCKQKDRAAAEEGSKAPGWQQRLTRWCCCFPAGGEGLIRAAKQTACARLRGCCSVRPLWPPGPHPPVGRKRGGGGGGGGANRSRSRASLTPPWTRDLTFRRLPITSALRTTWTCARTRTVLRWRVSRVTPGAVKNKEALKLDRIIWYCCHN